MLYLQWMPSALKNIAGPDGPDHGDIRQTRIKTRYNDMSAWAVFGLALRYASFLNVERLALNPFRDIAHKPVSKEDVDRLRTWLNLLTYDCNLTLTSGLPVSVDPTSAAQILRDFYRHRTAQDPGDLRYAALVELACIVQRVKGPTALSTRPPNVSSLKKANVEMEDWERYESRVWHHHDLC